MAKGMDENIRNRIIDHLEEIRNDFEAEEVENCLELINENSNNFLSELDSTILKRLIEDDEILKIIDEITIENEKGNAFD